MIDERIVDTIARATGAVSVEPGERIQTLWSGYGQIFRAALRGPQIASGQSSVVVKHVKWPSRPSHPAGWTSDLSHTRKVRSYEVECHFYRHFAQSCQRECRVPQMIAIDFHDNEIVMVLEDLDYAGFPVRKYRLSNKEIDVTLSWLAHFHATYLGITPAGLWPMGTYWHLETRPDELAAMTDDTLRQAAPHLDNMLNHAVFQTLVHGDAKVANFCYAKGAASVAAVDFQYVGGGCGMKDVAYFLGSCLHEDECERRENELLDTYFTHLHVAVKQRRQGIDFSALVREWRELYPVAWVDFHRFIKGWTVEQWHTDGYSERLMRDVLRRLNV